MLLYDLTSTYVEGEAAANPQMRRGYSRDHRRNCKQVVLALVVNPEGFPLAYEVFDRNRTDLTTLDDILTAVEAKYGQAQRVWVLDRGIVSEKNLATLRARGAQYLVGTPRVRWKAFERELLADDRQHVQAEVEVKPSPAPTAQRRLSCAAAPRGARRNRPCGHGQPAAGGALDRLAPQVAHATRPDDARLHQRLGRLKEHYARVAGLYAITVTGTGAALRLVWQERPSAEPGRRRGKGPTSCAPT